MACTRRVNRVLLTGLMLLVMSLAGAESAGAGTYVMRNCNVPGHSSSPVGPWRAGTNGVPPSWMDACSTGGGFGIRFPGRAMDWQSYAGIAFVRPADNERRAINLQRVRLWAVARLRSTGYPLFVTATAQGQPTTRVFNPPGSDAPMLYDTGTWTHNPTSFAMTLHCEDDRFDVPGCTLDHEVPLEIRGAEVTLSEDVAPVASVLGGTMLAAERLSGLRNVRYSATDRESGIERLEVALGDAVVAVHALSARCTYAEFTPCPVTDEDEIAVDTRRVADGRYPMSLRVYDAAGNRQVTQLPAVDVLNGSTAAPGAPGSSGSALGSSGSTSNSSASAEAAEVSASFAGSTRATRTVPYGRRVTLRGRLTTTASKRAIPHASVDVLVRSSRAGAPEVAVGSTRTGADGTFTYALERYRPSRTVRLVYRNGGAAPAESRFLRLKVRAASSLRATLSGTRIRFSGRVLTRPLPTGGKRVVLQGRAPGFAWSSFARMRTDRRGRFSGSYRLPIRRPGVKLRIRVVVPAERAYPYASYHGRPVSLRVR